MMIGLHGNAGYNLKCYAQPSSGVWHHLAAVFDKSQTAANEVTPVCGRRAADGASPGQQRQQHE